MGYEFSLNEWGVTSMAKLIVIAFILVSATGGMSVLSLPSQPVMACSNGNC
jgi:hypothetical protein